MDKIEQTIKDTVRALENHPEDSKKRWKIILDNANILYRIGGQSITGLEKLVLSKIRKEVLASIMYLGIMHMMGIDASKSINTIINNYNTVDEARELISLTTLAVLGHPEAVGAMRDHMKQEGQTSEKEWAKSGFTTTAYTISTGKTPP